MLRSCHAALAILVLAVPTAMAQTYDTPQTLAVVLVPPFHTYVDADGYTVATGMVHNESDAAYVGNVMILARFYGGISQMPLEAASGHALLDVIPPDGTSPYAVRSQTADPRINWAASTLLIFDAAGPKNMGLAAERQGTSIRIYDTGDAPHTNVTIHLVYQDAFKPPRILGTMTYHMGDMPEGGSLEMALPADIPPAARGVTAFVESDVFSGMPVSWITDTISQPPLPGQILDVWFEHDAERVYAMLPGQEITLNTEVYVTGNSTYWLYAQITDRDTGGVVFLDSVMVNKTHISIPLVAPDSGRYITEMFLWTENGIPASRPGPALPFIVG